MIFIKTKTAKNEKTGNQNLTYEVRNEHNGAERATGYFYICPERKKWSAYSLSADEHFSIDQIMTGLGYGYEPRSVYYW